MNRLKRPIRGFALAFSLLLMPLWGFAQDNGGQKITKNKVIVLGMIHDGHLTSTRYSLPFLRRVIENIDPDYVLAEIPPDRIADSIRGYERDGVVSETRVKRFPEYKDVLIPMSAHARFKIIATAAWTAPMAQTRREALKRLSEDPARAQDWQAYKTAEKAMDARLAGRDDDPLFINSAEYDAIIKEGLAPYATLFADDLGRGDWHSINTAHFRLIAAALDNHQGEGATFLITYGAGHKYWFLEKLRQRKDIILVDPAPYLQEAGNGAGPE